MKGESLEGWRLRVRQAPTEAELLQLLREYFGSVQKTRLAKLPASARPGAISSAEDVAAYTLQLTRDELVFSGDAETRALLREMLGLLSEANVRLAQLSGEGKKPPGLR